MKILTVLLSSITLLFSISVSSNEDMDPILLQQLANSTKSLDVEENVALTSSLVSINCEDEVKNIYGHSFFCTSPTSISPIGDLPVPSDYILSLRDELEIIYIGDEKNRSFIRPVRLDGTIILPEIGLINVEGLTLSEAKEKINSKLSNSYIGISAAISIKSLSAKKILIVGAVKTPGAYLINPFTTISNSLAYAGGLESYASLRKINLIKANGKEYTFDLYDILLKGDRTKDIQLNSGDTILVNTTTNHVELRGSILRPMIYEYVEGETGEHLIEFALGPTRRTNLNTSLIELRNYLSGLEIKYVKPDAIKDLDNVVSITLFDYANSNEDITSKGGLVKSQEYSNLIGVTLNGEFINPGQYLVKPGTSVADLYDLAGGLTKSANKDLTILTRESVKRQQLLELDRAKQELKREILASSNRNGTAVDPGIMSLAEISINENSVGRLSGDFTETSANSKNTLIENGDVLFIPAKTNVVTIIGEVMTPLSLVHRSNFGIEDYINLAGGYKDTADKKKTYVIGSNGLAKTSSKGWLVKKAKIESGDTIVIPLNIQRRTSAEITDLTSIISNIAFAAASLDALKD